MRHFLWAFFFTNNKNIRFSIEIYQLKGTKDIKTLIKLYFFSNLMWNTPYYLAFKFLLKLNFRAQENDVLKLQKAQALFGDDVTWKAYHKGELIIQMK